MKNIFSTPIGVVIVIAFIFGIIFFLTRKKKQKSYETVSTTGNIEKGMSGENTVANLLEYVKNSNGYKVFNDVLLNGGTNRSVQIDHIVVGRSGIYLVETKNYKGRILATEKEKWLQIPSPVSKPVAFYSPEKQGLYHLYVLAEAIGIKNKAHCHLITAVPDETDIENHSNAKILHFNELAGELCGHRGHFLTKETVETICERIQKANTNTPENIKKHIARVSKSYS